jgi:hypothetical protein
MQKTMCCSQCNSWLAGCCSTVAWCVRIGRAYRPTTNASEGLVWADFTLVKTSRQKRLVARLRNVSG